MPASDFRRVLAMVRVTLRRYKYPPDHQQEAIELVIKQAERLSEEWSEIGSKMN